MPASKKSISTYLRSPLILSVAYFAVISIVSHIPGNALSRVGVHIWDKSAHFFEYSLLGILLFLGFSLRWESIARHTVLLLTVAVIIALGSFDELHQMVVPGRESSLADVLADGIGGFTGACIAFLYLSFMARKGNECE